MSHYELVFLLSKKDDENIVKKILNEMKAKIIKEESWGEKTLAYPIKKNRHAFYFIYQIEINKKNIFDLRKKLNFEEKIIRYLLLLVNN